MKYKNVIFDFDGTIVDSQVGIAKAFKQALKSKGVDEDIEVINTLIGPPLSRTIITKYGFSEKDGAEAMEVHRAYLREKGIYEGGIFEGVVEMLKTLRENGVNTAIATNKPDEFAFAQIEHLDLGKYFDYVEGNNLPQTKGNKSDFIRMVIEHEGYDKKDTVMVGDRHHDIDGGKDNDLDTIWVEYGYGSDDERDECEPTYSVKTPKELTKIVLGE